jgi:hypothetical protein
MAIIDFKKKFTEKLDAKTSVYDICGVVTKDGVVYPLGSDTKVLSTVFELLTRPLIAEIAQEAGLIWTEPTVQNHYPDFTLMSSATDNKKIAIDVKTTYINKDTDSFNFTLGGYTSFIRGTGTKNIVYPFSEYSEHWVIGYVYTRLASKKSALNETFGIDQLDSINLPYEKVNVFVQEKWKIAGDKAGSGNTTNIGSINGRIDDFKNVIPIFASDAEYLEYWRGYETTAEKRANTYKNIDEFRALKKSGRI